MAVGAVTQRPLDLTNIIVGRDKLTAGTVTVSLKQITDNSLVFMSGDDANVDGVCQAVITSGTGFVITSQTGGDAGYVAWMVVLIP